MPRKHEKRRFLWFTDPWEWMWHPLDTTMRLAQEAQLLGHENHWASVKTLRLSDGKILADIHKLELAEKAAPASAELEDTRGGPLFRLPPLSLPPRNFDCILWRMDPPVDHTYNHPLQILLLGLQGKGQRKHRTPEIINPPETLFAANEKMEPALLGDLMPPSLISSQWQWLSEFGRREGRAVLKPLDWCQSKGIELLDWRTSDSRERSRGILDKATDGFKKPVLLQRFLEGVSSGERRLWFLDGSLLAHLVKFPMTGDFRVNVDQGSELKLMPLSPGDKKALPAISARLKARGIRLAAIDLIEGRVTDFNFTSPGLIPQLEKLTGENLARKIMRSLGKQR